MTELSPAAQAVLDAVSEVYWDWGGVPSDPHTIAAAAIRAAAEELHYKEQLGWTGYGYYTHFQNQIRVIADELESQ